ncbi:peritrophin-1-like [Uranotaenia lowii]|uniref:peritrophin-1-like n=1 Tax=Uranotaenia lowii TaxID=190385 RepID=UPI00247A13D2|nr:peritrophin-1-like [Uranotaenia lowii]
MIQFLSVLLALLMLINLGTTDDILCSGNDSGPTLYPSPELCDGYFVCQGGLAYPFRCASGLIFDMHSLQCSPPEGSQCLPDVLNPPTTEAPTTLSTTTIATSTDPVPSTVIPNDGSVKCAPWHVDFFPHPSDCTRYIKCFLGNPIVIRCPFNFRWNPTLRLCDFRSNVMCDDL